MTEPHDHHHHHLLWPPHHLLLLHSHSQTSMGDPPSPSIEPKPQLVQTASSTSPSPPSKLPFRPRKSRKTSSNSSPSPSSSAAVPLRLLPRPLSAAGELFAALRHLRAADPTLARVIDSHELPTFQSLHSPFHALARSILYQQLAYRAAASIYSRFLSLCGGESSVVPESVLKLSSLQLRQIGVSGRKASYLHDLARKYTTGILSDAAVVSLDDKSLFTMLTMVKGIGAWSVHMFMIFSLHRPDVLPVGDLAFRKGVQILYNLDEVPKPSQMEHLCQGWRPYRSVGAWYMWRLAESKGAPSISIVPPPVPAITSQVGDAVALQQPIIESIHMLPNLS